MVAFDGKQIRGAANKLNRIIAWANRSQLTLGIADAGEGAQEQGDLRQLLSVVNVSDCLVTADGRNPSDSSPMHTHTDTAQAIVDKKVDYLLALKGNQGTMLEAAQTCFGLIRAGETNAADSCVHQQKRGAQTYEERRCWTLTDVGLVDPWAKWAKLQTAVCVARRVFKDNVLQSEQVRYFLSSASGSACRFLRATRLHWGIENSQH